MAQYTKPPVRDFLQEAIKGLSKENFDELVRIFQLSYWNNVEVVNVDGANDGGSDIKIFKDKKEQKKCIQVTVQKQGLALKIYRDLKKVFDKISEYGYSKRFEFYCSSSISDENIEEYKRKAKIDYDIDLEVYEAKRLSQLNCLEITEYIYSLHSGVVLSPEQMSIDKATKTLYDLLAHGKASSDIKNSLVDSVIITILYEKAPIELNDLKTELETRMGKKFPDVLQFVNSLKTDQRIVKDAEKSNLIRLSEFEYNNVKEILSNSARIEKEFCDTLSDILNKYQIKYSDDVLNKLKNLYKNNYDDNNKNEESFEAFKKFLLSLIDNQEKIDGLLNDIKNLCSSNSFLNRISASEYFFSLYKSNQLKSYLNQKHKDIYLDTPTFVYLLCDYYGADEKSDWDNLFYRSVKSLMKLRDAYRDKITLHITQNYLGEVAGEIKKKGLLISQFEKFPFFKDMGGTSNTLFNYYNFLKKEQLLEDEDSINSFDDFIYSLGLETTDPKDAKFHKNVLRFLREVADQYDIEVVNWSQNEKYMEFKVLYEKLLLTKEKIKSDTAICNDVNQVLESLCHEDCYIATWDTTICLLRDKILENDENKEYYYFNICNPSQLSNKIALENFNIEESALTNDIFAYADKRYDISNRVKSLLDLIAPFLKEDGTGSKNLFRKLGRIRKSQIELIGSDSGNEREENNLPIEEIFMLLIPDKEREKEDEDIIDKFSAFMSSEENTDYIIDLIDKMSVKRDFKSFDLTDYFERVKSVNLEE